MKKQADYIKRIEIKRLWLQKWAQNFPMALCWQIFFAGPGVRNFFRLFERR